MVDISHIKRLAKEFKFDICGVTQAAPLTLNKPYFDEWLAKGYGDPLEYMSRYYDIRFDPSGLLEGARTVIVCGVNYKNEYSLTQHTVSVPHIASYALSRDYHKTIRKRLKGVLKSLKELYPSLSGRCFTDSAPLLEKQLAVNCGLGWIGRQSLLVTPEFGSFVLLGEIIIDQQVSSYDAPFVEDRCGSCRKCVESCPVSAILENRTIDSRLCISCRTVEVDNQTGMPLNGWVFGCDECQSCCPHNQKTPQYANEDFTPIISPPNIEEWGVITDELFDQRFGSTPLKRAGLKRLKESACGAPHSVRMED